MNNNINIENDKYICPLTLYYMKNPVKASDGKIYEEKAIKKWFEQNKTSPFTREILTDEFQLQKNLQKEIDLYLKKNNIERDDSDDNYYELIEDKYIRELNCPFCDFTLIIRNKHLNCYSKCPRCFNRLYFSDLENNSHSTNMFILPNTNTNNTNAFFCQIM